VNQYDNAAPWKNWYSLKRWRDRRAEQLRSEPLCRFCTQDGAVTAASHADHIIPHRGDAVQFWHGSLQSLCAHHHQSDKQREEKAGFSYRTDASGYPLDQDHPANRAHRR
jgi:5-methylcytosine-specific restriction protein A